LFELIGLARSQLSGFNEFLEFGIHVGSDKLRKTRRCANGNLLEPLRRVKREIDAPSRLCVAHKATASEATKRGGALALRVGDENGTVCAVSTNIWFWIAFHVGVFIALAVDLTTFKRRDRELSMRAALRRSFIWIVLSLAFNVLVWKSKGDDAGLDFLTGYIIEYSLSVDNIFVFVLIFAYFRVPPRSQHRVLVWGILGALVMRGVMIWLGVTLVERFHFVLYIFGAFLVLTGLRMLFDRDAKMDFEKNFFMRWCRKILPITQDFQGRRFHVIVDGKFCFTPLLLVLILVDVMDLVFAVDSIPAVFAITTDQFIVYTSNICAILGLRSLYFLLARMIDRFIYLKTGLALILFFVGTKMIVARPFPIPNWISLLVILVILACTITISLVVTKRRSNGAPTVPPEAE
jgi:tellurite resistance protein TerC